MPLPNTTIAPAEVRAALQQAVDQVGSQRTYASSIGISQAYLADVLNSRRAAGDKILAALGLRRIAVVVALEDVR